MKVTYKLIKASAIVAAIAATTALSGCAIAPGMTMTEPAEVPEGEVVRVTPITLDLLNQLEERQELAVRKVVEEFVDTCNMATSSAMAMYCRSSSGITPS